MYSTLYTYKVYELKLKFFGCTQRLKSTVSLINNSIASQKVIQMVHPCDVYIEASKFFSNPKDCESCHREAVEFIEEAINVKTSRVKSLKDCGIMDKRTSTLIMELRASQEVVELPFDELTKIIGYRKEGVVGSYHPKTGRIFLIEEEWCFSNLIHETLHSRSAFSKKDLAQSNLLFVSDGLTEFLVGLVLKRKISSCYKKWQIVNDCFLSPYEKWVKPWYYLTSKADFKPIISLYFDVKEQNPLEKLGKVLQELISGEFENIFLNYNPTERMLFDRFKDQLGKVYGKDFADFQDSQTKFLLDHLDNI